jgi:hypothetical protein
MCGVRFVKLADVASCMINGRETGTLSVESLIKLARTEVRSESLRHLFPRHVHECGTRS